MPLVGKVWNEKQVIGWEGFRLHKKLQELRTGLKAWNLNVVGNMESKLKDVETKLHDFDLLAELGTLSEEKALARRNLYKEMWDLSRMVERLWL